MFRNTFRDLTKYADFDLMGQGYMSDAQGQKQENFFEAQYIRSIRKINTAQEKSPQISVIIE